MLVEYVVNGKRIKRHPDVPGAIVRDGNLLFLPIAQIRAGDLAVSSGGNAKHKSTVQLMREGMIMELIPIRTITKVGPTP